MTPSAFESTEPAKNAAIPAHPRQVMAPGWYWKLLEAGEAGALWSAFTSDNPSVKTRKTRAVGEGTAGEKGAWVLFEVTGTESVLWTLPGLPSRAPLGRATEYQDTLQSPEPEPSGTDLLEGFLGGLRNQLGAAGTVVLWGGAALLLWQLAQLAQLARRRRS